MLVILRIVFGLALAWSVVQVRGVGTVSSGNLTPALWLAVCLVLGILNALVWAPFVGGRLADPLTTGFTQGTYVPRRQLLLRFARWAEARRHRQAALVGAFLEGINRPDMPEAFVIGLRNATPGSWLEKVFAREVFRFDHTKRCIWAYEILRRHGVDPGLHARPEVNLVLRSIERPAVPEPERLAVPGAAPQMPVARDQRIVLFDGAATEPLENPAEPAIGPEGPQKGNAQQRSES